MLEYVFVQLVMKKIRTNTSVNNDEIQKPNKQTFKNKKENKQTQRRELIKMEDNDDHNEDEVVVHSSVVDDHSHKVLMVVMVHYILAAEKDVEAEEDHMMVAVDECRADNLFVDRNNVEHEDDRMEDIVVDVVVQDNVKQVDEEDVAN